MTANTQIYPSDFPGSGTIVSQTELDIQGLQDDSSAQARKLVYSRILMGLAAIKNQHSVGTIGASIGLMPFNRVGPNTVAAVGQLGNVGYFYAGNNLLKGTGVSNYDRTVTRFGMLGETTAIAGFQATIGRRWPGTVGDSQRFWAVGGWRAIPGISNSTVDRVHIPSESIRRLGENTSAGLFQSVGCGAKFTGYFFGAYGAGWTIGADDSVSRSIHRISFQTETVTQLTEMFNSNRSAGVGTAGSRFHAYLIGGVGFDASLGANGARIQYDTIEQFAYNGEILSSLGIGQAGQYHRHTVKFGNADHIYVVNPAINNSQGETPAHKVIFRFNIATSSLQMLGINSDQTSVAAGGFGNNINGYWGGGFNIKWYTGEETPITTINRIEKLANMSSTETTQLLGVEMAANQANSSGISNYAAGYAS